ncbi:MAG TPA: tRNA (N6-isopentenyl adenosine(37)-C2)-methylthiotransferase MiaB [Syntrophales bacterium]|nr:tRNA (N6-isopentenyl adenosine(37)-C2)-methylthiotransferase MiaB [Syntrophobacterales bacterium]HRR41682.1 tRNA (N6-isopentenyl adenosine(37)-C2)-methylthiotransferase MiaB [Syntrophales bacterium]
MKERYFYIHTFGCQMNVQESGRIADILRRDGYLKTNDVRKADVLIVNTCSVREKAEQKAYSLIGRLKDMKKGKPGRILCIGGCVAQQQGEDLLRKTPGVDVVFGTHHVHRVSELIRRFKACGRPVVETAFLDGDETINIDGEATPDEGAVSAYVTIMQGCNNFCSFCVVPYLRGREKSRTQENILDEVRRLAARGIKEVVLLGQNVNSYGRSSRNGASFPGLLQEIGAISGVERIRFTSSHPKDLTDEIIGCFGRIKALCEHIHLPVQSGSDRILNRMNRQYTRSDYIEMVGKLRAAAPGISITSDMIVGYPGETEDDFEDTLSLMETVRFDGLFSFKYSDRGGTLAACQRDKVAEEVKNVRLTRLQSLQDTHTLEINKALEGRTEEVLVEGISKNANQDVSGRTRTNKIVNFRGSVELIGKTVNVTIVKTYRHSLRGEMI